jgi:acyl dehydratase
MCCSGDVELSLMETKKTAVGLTLEDLSVGQVFRSGSYVIDAQQIKDFARQFDPQPFHTDEDAAKQTFFGELVASGWHTASITMRLVVESTPLAGGLVGASTEVSWPNPTRPGDILHCEGEVLEIKPSKSRPDRGMITVRTITFNQKGETVQILTSKMVVPRRGHELR